MQTVIVYRNPLEAFFWENPVEIFLLISMLTLTVLAWCYIGVWIDKVTRRWRYRNLGTTISTVIVIGAWFAWFKFA